MSVQVKVYDEFQRVDPTTGRGFEADSPSLDGVKLSAGRGEFASFQVVVGPFEKAGKASAAVKASPLKGKAGTISSRQYDLLAEWYVLCEKPPKRRRPAPGKPVAAGKRVPEVLLPLDLFDGQLPLGLPGNEFAGQKHQGLWVDLFVPEDAAPGDYAGKLTVTVDGESCDVPIELSVDTFTQPLTPGFTFLMNNYCDAISSGWPELGNDLDRHYKPKYRRIEKSFWRTAHDHRSVFYYLPYLHSGYIFPTFAPELEGEGPNKRVKSWSDWDKHFGPYFDGSAFKGTRRGAAPVPRFFLPISLDWPADFLKWGRPGYADEFKAVMGQMADHFKKKGWTGTIFDMFLNHKQRFKLFPWDCEEVRFLEDNEIHREFRKLWEGTLDHETTAPVRFDYTNGSTWTLHHDMKSDLAEFTDMFICQSQGTARAPKRAAELREQGVQFCLCGGGCTMADPLLATAFWPLQFWVWGGDSFMIWTSMMWGDDPYDRSVAGGRTTLLYPGSKFGAEEPFVSLRLKTIRNMLQRFERLNAATNDAGGWEAIRRQAGQAMGIPLKDWFPSGPDEDFSGSEEKPLAGWDRATAAGFRALDRLARRLTK